MSTVGDRVTVPIKGAAASKINWKEAVTILGTTLAFFGIEFDNATQQVILGAIGWGSPIVGMILRTFFTKSVIASSV